MIPPMITQPFIENAIIHGVAPKKENGLISINFTLEGEELLCEIIDNGIGIFNSQKGKENLVNVHKSMALNITKKRLKMMETILNSSGQPPAEKLKQLSDLRFQRLLSDSEFEAAKARILGI